MNTTEILKSARASGITLTVTDGKLIIRGVGTCAAGLLESIRADKLKSFQSFRPNLRMKRIKLNMLSPLHRRLEHPNFPCRT